MDCISNYVLPGGPFAGYSIQTASPAPYGTDVANRLSFYSFTTLNEGGASVVPLTQKFFIPLLVLNADTTPVMPASGSQADIDAYWNEYLQPIASQAYSGNVLTTFKSFWYSFISKLVTLAPNTKLNVSANILTALQVSFLSSLSAGWSKRNFVSNPNGSFFTGINAGVGTGGFSGLYAILEAL